MAEGDDATSDTFRSKLHNSNNSDDSESENQVHANISVNFSRTMKAVNGENYGASGSGLNDAPKREDNPFSFKHFLRSDANYQSQGARPKVYCEGRPISSVSDLDLQHPTEPKQTRIVPEFSSALPDFVQDHLVMEQSYLGKDAHGYSIDVNNLPDFAPSRSSVNVNRLNMNSSRNMDRSRSDNCSSIPLDLPVRPQADFPLDLPMADPQSSGIRNCQSGAEVGNSKSLPDFLADGAVCTQANDENNHDDDQERDIADRLRLELDHTRRDLAEQIRRADNLQRELEIARNKEHEYTQNLAKALEQVENNLERANRRLATAENATVKYRQEIKSLMCEINQLKKENRHLRGDEGASGGPQFPGSELQSQRLAQELRNAASTAEHSLRQLLTGVDNLRIMAASLDNLHRIEERTESFLDLNDETGPAL